MRNGTVPIPTIASDFVSRNSTEEFCPNGDTETQKERVDDRVSHSNTPRGDVSASQLERSRKYDVTRENEHDGCRSYGGIAEIV